jgi:hypothetical protein
VNSRRAGSLGDLVQFATDGADGFSAVLLTSTGRGRHPFGFERGDDREQVAYRLGKSVQFSASELVPFSDAIERRLKLLTLGHR